MADKWQMSNGFYRPTAAPRPQLDLGARAHQSDQFQPRAHLQAHLGQLQVPTHPQSQATGSFSLNNIRPVDNPNNALHHVLESINRLSVQQHYFNESLARTDKRLEELLSSVLSLRETADGLTKKLDTHDGIKEALERSSRGEDNREKEIDVMRVLVGEMKAFKKTLGKSCDGDDGRTVLGRLDAITFAVGELLERARDPEANLPEPTPTIVKPCIIDLTRSTPPLEDPISTVHSRTYAEVGTSFVSSPSPLKEKSFTSIRASSQCGSGSFSPYPCRSSSAHAFVKDTTATSSDTVSTALTQDNLELAYPISMGEDTMDSTEPTIDSKTTSSIITSNLEAVSRTQKNNALSNASVTARKTPDVESTTGDVDLSMPTLDDKNDNSTDIHHAGLLNETPGPGSSIQTFKQPTSTASASSASPAITLTPFAQTEMQHSADKNIASLTVPARVNSYLENVNSSASEGKEQQKEQSQEQGLPERLESPLSTSTRDGGTPSLDNLNSEELNKGADEKGYNELTIKATKGAKEINVTEKPTSIELNENRVGDVPAPTPATPGRIDLSLMLQRRRSSSSRVASPSTSLSIRGRTGSRLNVSSPEDVTYSSSLPSDTKFFPLKTNVLAGAGVSCSSAAQPPTTPAAASRSASITTKTPVTSSIQKPAESAFRPTLTNTELVATIILPATPASIFKSPLISPTERITPAALESSHLESATAMTNSPLPLSPTSTLPAATSAAAVLTISPTTPVASPRLGPLASPAAIFNELPPPSQASNISQDEVFVSRMVIEENQSNEGEVENLAEKTTGKSELKMASRNFEEEEEEKPDRRLSLSLSPLSSLSPSISGSPYHLPVKASGPSTPGPQSALFFTSLPRSPLALATSKHTQAPETPSPSTTPFVAVVPSSYSPKPINLDLNIECPSPLFSSPTNSISVEQRKEEEEGSMSNKLKSPDDNNDGTTNPAIRTTVSKVVASVSTHIPAQVTASNEILLPRNLSPISEVENGKRTIEGTDKIQVEKVYASVGDNADIVRVRKRKVSEGSSRINHELLAGNSFGPHLYAKGTGKERSSMTDREPLTLNPLGLNPVSKKKRKEIDDLEVETKASEVVKKRSLLNLKVGKKGDSLAVTRVRKRKARPDSVDGVTDGMRQHDDGLDEEKPLKRARQRVSDSQMKTEPAEKGNSESNFGVGAFLTTAMKQRSSVSVKRGSPSKARISVNRGQGKAEVKWPTIAEEYKDLVGCDKCTAWYHYGCVGLSAGDKRLRSGEKFFCPPCEAGTTIKKLNLYADCWRPGCTIWTGYIVEKIIGRFKKFVDGKKYQFKYLLQWKGYKLSESSWEPEESMFDPSYMIEKFRVDALKEGIDIDKEETGVILLQVAKDPSVPQPT